MKRNAFLFYGLLILTNLLYLTTACVRRSPSPETKIEQNTQGPLDKLISTRPEKSGPLKVLIRLPADPLAKAAKENRMEQLALIQSQQKDLVQKLKAISSEVQIIYSYKNILNGLFVVIPEEHGSKIDAILPEGSHVELSTVIRRPITQEQIKSLGAQKDLKNKNSVKFIGADQLHAQGIKGQGMTIGIIDTGIDYTHSMLGGTGSIEDYKSIPPHQSNSFFPNNKVVGGYDFVGTEYDAAAADPLFRIPKPDENPIDESGHGSHVAGTVAGISINAESYDGVAPDAQLYALKVFGKSGSTDDAIVIAALEFAADPDHNPETLNPLDVVNLSLGSPYGNPNLLYKEAITHLNALGTVIVASAGNSGNISYITGSPAVNNEAFSVAASIDDMEHNWHFSASSFKVEGDKEDIIAEMTEATFSKPLKEIEALSGKLVYVEKAKVITEEQASLLQGQIALIDRGEITFSEKIKNVFKAGAIAAVVINNTEGAPFVMGGDNETIDIPAIMIGLNPGKIIRESVQKGVVVTANLKSDQQIQKPELIDTLTDFSSRGPRSEDSIIKPEIAAPGANIISAKSGGGNEVVAMSGTSMAAPHMAGVVALLKQMHPSLSAQELKSLAMLTAHLMKDPKGQPYPVALQGAGRVQVFPASTTPLTLEPAALSLGRNEVILNKTISRKIKIKNLDSQELTLAVNPQLNSNLVLISPKTISLKAHEERLIDVQIKIQAPTSEGFAHELDGFLHLVDSVKKKTYSLPVLSVALKISQLSSEPLKIQSTSDADSPGSLAQLTIHNASPQIGLGFLFNLLGRDGLKEDRGFAKQGLTTSCDLESVGYRTLVLESKGQKTEVLQMALKLYNPLTTWNYCEFSVQIDTDNDGVADQELAGANRANTPGLGVGMASLLLDANKARVIRKDYDTKIAAKTPDVTLDFTGAIETVMDVVAMDQSTLMIIQAPIKNLKSIPGQNLRVKVAALNVETELLEADDFLGQSWMELPLNTHAQTLVEIPETLSIPGNSSLNVPLTKGEGHHPLILYYPFNRASMTSAPDQQSQILSTEFVDTLGSL